MALNPRSDEDVALTLPDVVTMLAERRRSIENRILFSGFDGP